MKETVSQEQQHPAASLMSTELFSRFFTRLLEREEKFPIFLREWENFQGLINQSPLDQESITQYLTYLPCHIDRDHDSASVISLPVPDLSFSSPIRPQRTTHRHMTSDRKSRFSIDQGIQEVHSIMPSINFFGDDKDNESNSTNPSTQQIGNLLNIHDLQCIKANSSEIDVLRTIQEVPIADEAPKEKYDLSFLASKARLFRENYHYHTGNLDLHFTDQVKPSSFMSTGDRSPLRGVKVYNHTKPIVERSNNVASNKAAPGYKTNMYQALKELADRMNENSGMNLRSIN